MRARPISQNHDSEVKPRLRGFVRFLLGLIFVYFISLMVVMGNGASFLGYYLSPIYLPVASTIGLNTTWNFFSPDPAHKMTMRVTLIKSDGSEDNLIYPKISENGEFDFDLRHRRFSYVIRFLIMDMAKIEGFFAPWICRQYPDTERLYIQTEIEKIPALQKAVTFKDSIFNDLLEKQLVSEVSFDCSKSIEGVDQ